MNKLTLDVPVLIVDGTPDSQGDVFVRDGISFAEHVPVVYENNPTEQLGVARLYMAGHRLFAKMNLDVTAKLVAGLVPSINGYIQVRQGSNIVRCRVLTVSLGRSNADPRVPKLPQPGTRIAFNFKT